MNDSTTSSVPVTDPVCGMTIDPTKAVGSSTYGGETYHFCSRGCETRFDAAPAEYAGAAAAPGANASSCASPMPGKPARHSCC